jgi:general secretion pathway protein I
MRLNAPALRCGYGVALLEVLVALVLLAGSGLVVIAWVQQSLESVSRTQRARFELQVLRSAQARVALVNPAVEASGRSEQLGFRLEWTSRAVEPMNGIFIWGLEGRATDPPWRVGLFEVEARVYPDPKSSRDLQADAGVISFKSLMIGYQPVRPRLGVSP